MPIIFNKWFINLKMHGSSIFMLIGVIIVKNWDLNGLN